MKEHPILFSADMVRAIREGHKSQTRRVVKPQPQHGIKYREYIAVVDGKKLICPYGQPGDHLWVRETFWRGYSGYCEPEAGEWTPVATRRIEYIEERHTSGYNRYGHYMRKMPSIFMPRWASRLTLAVTGVRVERLRDISEEDAEAEGIQCPAGEDSLAYATWSAIPGFVLLWDSINAKRGYSWAMNPWVFVIEFDVLQEQEAWLII